MSMRLAPFKRILLFALCLDLDLFSEIIERSFQFLQRYSRLAYKCDCHTILNMSRDRMIVK